MSQKSSFLQPANSVSQVLIPDNGGEPADPKFYYDHRVLCRGRVAFVIEDDAPEVCYFIAQRMEHDAKIPNVVGRFNFDFVSQWEKKN